MTGIYLVVALIALALLLSINTLLKSTALKVAIITSTFVVASLVYFSFETYKGWPTREEAKTGQIIAISIVEPRGRIPGAIYFWLVDDGAEMTWREKLYTYKSDLPDAPRAFWIPYSKDAAKKFGEAQDALEQGMVVTVEGQESDGKSSNGEGTGTGNAAGEGKAGDSRIKDYEVPRLNIEPPDKILKKG